MTQKLKASIRKQAAENTAEYAMNQLAEKLYRFVQSKGLLIPDYSVEKARESLEGSPYQTIWNLIEIAEGNR